MVLSRKEEKYDKSLVHWTSTGDGLRLLIHSKLVYKVYIYII